MAKAIKKTNWEDVIKASVKDNTKSKKMIPKLSYKHYDVTVNGDTYSIDVAKHINNVFLIQFSEAGDVNEFDAYGFYAIELTNEKMEFFIDKKYQGKLTYNLMNEIYEKVKEKGLPKVPPTLIKV